MASDMPTIFQWWGTLFLVGAAAYPLTQRLFRTWFDCGYLFSKAVGMAAVTFIVYILGVLHIAPFVPATVWAAMGGVFVLGLLVSDKSGKEPKHHPKQQLVFLLEEIFFFTALLFWSWIKAHEPSIQSLEKFMDFGFANSILSARFFPAPDMWYAGSSINYYYFGHTVMAVLTKLSAIDLTSTFNLMLASIFAWTLTMSFSIAVQLIRLKAQKIKVIGQVAAGSLSAFLVTLGGNMQTIYAFTKGYDGDAVQPFWRLLWPIGELVSRVPDGVNRYWYANATRFIPYTIHEFPSYSFVVSDVHGHVLSLPFVLLAIALLLAIFAQSEKKERVDWVRIGFYGFLCGVLLMTNALDGPIYLGLFLLLLIVDNCLWKRLSWEKIATVAGIVVSAAGITSLPFLLYFRSFVTGIAVNCPIFALADTKIGPILFEGVEKCQHSPLWMLWILWGFFLYCGLFLLALLVKNIRMKKPIAYHELVLGIFFVFSILLIIFPEFFYFKDIYPMHFRSNTMFKLGYQAFIMFSLVSGYVIVSMLQKKKHLLFFLFLVPQLFLVSIYPIFSVRSYFNSLRVYEGISGTGWIARRFPDDWAGIGWLNANAVKGGSSTSLRATMTGTPVIVEADGDSYTEYNRVSVFTGLPTIAGWSVHEWLWRGSYEAVSPRKEEVRQIFESENIEETRQILKKYNVTYVFVGSLEREKFKNLQEWKFDQIGKSVFTSGRTVIYEVH